MNLIDLILQDGLHLKRKAATHGGEFAGPCFYCGGDDRLCVWPYKGGKGYGTFWCRQCGKYGDAIRYLRDVRGMKYVDACAYLNVTPDLSGPTQMTETFNKWTPREVGMPPELWRRKAGAFLKEAINALWSVNGTETRHWLQDFKGLREATIRSAMLGLNPNDTYRKRESWGLAPSINEVNGKPRKLWLPAGIIIPCIHDGEVVRLRIRRFKAERGGRYIIVSGSDMRSMSFSTGNQVMCVVESELDAVLLNQETGDVAGVVAIGSANARPDKKADQVLQKVKTILLSLDYDIKNDKPTPAFNIHFWSNQYKKVKRWPCPIGKDPAEAFLAGLNLRTWIESALQ